MKNLNHELQEKWLKDVHNNMTANNKPSEWLEGLTVNHQVFVKHNLKLLILLQLKKITVEEIKKETMKVGK